MPRVSLGLSPRIWQWTWAAIYKRITSNHSCFHPLLTVAVGTELAGSYFSNTAVASSLRRGVYDPWAFYLYAALLYEAFTLCKRFPLLPPIGVSINININISHPTNKWGRQTPFVSSQIALLYSLPSYLHMNYHILQLLSLSIELKTHFVLNGVLQGNSIMLKMLMISSLCWFFLTKSLTCKQHIYINP